MKVYKSRLRCGKHEFLIRGGGILDPVNLIPEFRELARHIAAFIVQHVRRKNQLVAIVQMLLYKEIQKGPFQPCACTPVYPCAVTRNFCAALVIDQAKILTELHMIFRLKIKGRFFLIIMERFVLLLATCYNVLVRQVGQGEHQFLLLFL